MSDTDATTESEKPSMTVAGTVEKVIQPVVAGAPEKAEISIEHAESQHRKIRVENVLTDENGETVALKEGAHVEVTIEADAEDTKKVS